MTDSSATPAEHRLVRSSAVVGLGTALSRITGLLRVSALAALGLGALTDVYNIANSTPNIVYELLLGGVLAGVVIPTLVRAQHEDADDGQAFTQRLLTVSFVVLAVGTVIAVA